MKNLFIVFVCSICLFLFSCSAEESPNDFNIKNDISNSKSQSTNRETAKDTIVNNTTETPPGEPVIPNPRGL
jgi:hypothetical protein